MTQTTDLEQWLRGAADSLERYPDEAAVDPDKLTEAADEIARLREALEVASSALSNAAENGFYVGEGVFEKINAALKGPSHG